MNRYSPAFEPTPTAEAATIAEVLHRRIQLNGTELHYVEAGKTGSPVLLVHGFPETWWAFHKLIPLLATRHKVFAVDLRGFGDSSHADGPYDSRTMAEDLRQLVEHLQLGPIHLTGQDLSGPLTYTFAATHPELVRSFSFIESSLNGFGLEQLMDVTHGGSWHFGFFAAPGIPEMLLRGHEREFLTSFAYEGFAEVKGAIGPRDIDEFLRTFAQADGFRGTTGLYSSMLTKADALPTLSRRRLPMPVLAVGALGNRGFGEDSRLTMEQVADNVRGIVVANSGHFVAQERPEELATELAAFFDEVDAAAAGPG